MEIYFKIVQRKQEGGCVGPSGRPLCQHGHRNSKNASAARGQHYGMASRASRPSAPNHAKDLRGDDECGRRGVNVRCGDHRFAESWPKFYSQPPMQLILGETERHEVEPHNVIAP